MDNELHIRMAQAVAGLDDLPRRLWGLLASGHSLRASAERLGLSYPQVKRLQYSTFAQLRNQLMDCFN
jgi:DNA-directed RNA polymerase specialized sigma24 family protein